MVHSYYSEQMKYDFDDFIENSDFWTPETLEEKIKENFHEGLWSLKAMEPKYDPVRNCYIVSYDYMVLDCIILFHMSFTFNKKIKFAILEKEFEYDFDWETPDQSIKKFFAEKFTEIQKAFEEKYSLITNLLELEQLVRESLGEIPASEKILSMIIALSNI